MLLCNVIALMTQPGALVRAGEGGLIWAMSAPPMTYKALHTVHCQTGGSRDLPLPCCATSTSQVPAEGSPPAADQRQAPRPRMHRRRMQHSVPHHVHTHYVHLKRDLHHPMHSYHAHKSGRPLLQSWFPAANTTACTVDIGILPL
jgi:hypothetical protein